MTHLALDNRSERNSTVCVPSALEGHFVLEKCKYDDKSANRFGLAALFRFRVSQGRRLPNIAAVPLAKDILGTVTMKTRLSQLSASGCRCLASETRYSQRGGRHAGPIKKTAVGSKTIVFRNVGSLQVGGQKWATTRL